MQKNQLLLDIPITIAGMSFGALSGANAKDALGRGASAAMGTSTTTGDGGMTPGRKKNQSKYLSLPITSLHAME